MPILFYFIYGSLLIFLTITVINILTGPMLKKRIIFHNQPLVSVLIPARNEAENIAQCLEGLIRQDYQNTEIIVLDDLSSDGTGKIAWNFINRFKALKVIDGEPLPEGWTGKNWACHQLSKAAKGEILIFTDADNRHQNNAVSNTLGWIEKYELGLFSAFPQQKTGTLSERLVIPVIDLFLYSSLVLWLTYYLKFPSLAAANGQWLAFTRTAYQKIRGHQAVKSKIVEDVELSRLAKKGGIKILTTAGTGIISSRMYNGFLPVWRGFSKNLFGLVSNKSIPFILILLGILFTYLLPFVLLFKMTLYPYALISVLWGMLIRFLLAIKYKHPFFESVLLHPIGLSLSLIIAVNSFIQNKFGTVLWKDRQY